jgi:hypothetical protein
LDVVDLNRALEEMETFDPGRVRVVELRYFGGLSLEECVAVLGISPVCSLSGLDRGPRVAFSAA